MTDPPDGVTPGLPERGRWVIVGGLSLLALPVVFSFAFFALVAADGCVANCTTPQPRPLLAAALVGGAAVMGGGWAGLVPWAMGRPWLVGRTFVTGTVLVAVLVGSIAAVG